MRGFVTLLVVVGWALTAEAQTRIWTDASGVYRFQADLMGYNPSTVILKKGERELLTVAISDLSTEDQEYLKSQEAQELAHRNADQMQTWTMANGLKVEGRAVDYAQKDLTVQRRRSRVYFNDRPLSNLPLIQRRIVVKIVEHLENQPLADEEALAKWLDDQPHTYHLEGVIFEHKNGDEFGVPFFFFNEKDREFLQSGWNRWLQAKLDAEQENVARATAERESLALQHASDQYLNDQEYDRQVKKLELGLLATAAGVIDLWEVQVIPGVGVLDYPRTVIVPGRTSQDARIAVAQQYPNYAIGAIAKVRRDWR